MTGIDVKAVTMAEKEKLQKESLITVQTSQCMAERVHCKRASLAIGATIPACCRAGVGN
jgi:hypothetical protein